MKSLARALIAAILALPFPPVLAQDRLAWADDLAATAREAAARRVPIMIVFTEASCPYCNRARREHLVPLQSRGAFADKVIVREVDVAADRRLRDFDGSHTTHRQYAQRHQIRRVPTVVVMNARGEPLSAPIVGLMSEDFYRLYLEHAIEEGLYKLRVAR